jgi:hypothetical protein
MVVAAVVENRVVKLLVQVVQEEEVLGLILGLEQQAQRIQAVVAVVALGVKTVAQAVQVSSLSATHQLHSVDQAVR